VIELQMKYIHFVVDSERLVDQSFSADFISIEWIESPDPGDNCGGTDYRAGTDFLQNEKVMVAASLFDPAIEGAKRLVDAVLQSRLLRWQSGQPVLDYISQIPETGKIMFVSRP
jgi:hypothetical protein